MYPQTENKNAIAAIRVSTTKQGRDGDSPDAQKEQIEQFAARRGITIKQFFVFLESASKELQPMQQAVNYCKDPKNNVQLLIVKSIDRFTRGGSHSYDEMKMQLDSCGVKLIDIYGVISGEEVNTLEHLGFEYKWSKYSPSKKTEILEAERAKDELRDIMSRMIGAEIRYTQNGYWMRQAPYGFTSEKVETRHGKRCVLKPCPGEAKFVIMMYELRAKGLMHDEDIVERVNNLGFKTRVRYLRDKHDRTKILAKCGGEPLNVKAMQKILRNPIYAGINAEKWTGGKAVKCAFKGLVDIETFNRANKGKRMVVEGANGEITIYNKRAPEHLVNKGIKNPDFAFRKFVMCPECHKPLHGSYSRGKSGKRYPAYHCTTRGHHFRVPKQELEDTVAAFIRNLTMSDDHVDAVVSAVAAEYEARQQALRDELQAMDERITQLQADAEAAVGKIKVLSSETAIKYMEEDLMKVEAQIKDLRAEKAKKEAEKPANIQAILARVKYFMKHLDEILQKQIDPVKKAQLFGIIFDTAPTFAEIKNGTPEGRHFLGVAPVLRLAHVEKSLMVRPEGFEPPILGTGNLRFIQLSYGRTCYVG